MNDIPLGLLKRKREMLGLSAEEVINKLSKRGIDISAKTLYGYENGVSTPRVNTFIALCDIYHINDIMGEFGYHSNVKLATGDNEWHDSVYNDFFNASLLGKIYILMENGVPSFEGYEDQLEKCFPKNADAANYDKLYFYFSKLNERGKGAALYKIKELCNDPDFLITDNSLTKDIKIS